MSVMERSCLICGARDPAYEALFFPEHPEVWGAPEGKNRVFRYRLCERCMGRADKAAVVEKIIQHELSGGTVYARNQ